MLRLFLCLLVSASLTHGQGVGNTQELDNMMKQLHMNPAFSQPVDKAQEEHHKKWMAKRRKERKERQAKEAEEFAKKPFYERWFGHVFNFSGR